MITVTYKVYRNWEYLKTITIKAENYDKAFKKALSQVEICDYLEKVEEKQNDD